MKLNGSLAILGFGPHTFDSIAAATAAGENGLEKKGILRLAGGIKIQWDGVQVAANTSAVITLSEAYTEEHYTAICSFDTAIGPADTQLSVNCWIPSAAPLSTLVIRNIFGAAVNYMYISIGKDLVS